MSYTIENEDMNLIRQMVVHSYVKIEILNDNGTIKDSIEGIISGGSSNIDGTSDIRRTCNFTIIPTINQEIRVNEESYIWLNKAIKMEVGIENLRTKEVKWWSQGYYLFTDTNGTYDANTNTLQVNCADFMVLFDGSRNGALGQYQIQIPAYKENPDTGEVIEYNYIRDAIIETVSQLGRVTRIQVDDVGEYKGLQEKNPDGYIAYRQANPTWNCIPYDLEFNMDTTVLEILKTLRDLYPNYETFFDENNVFVCRMKPSGYNDPISLTNQQLQSILISENTESTQLTFSEVKNISEVWGEVIEADFYTEEGVTYSNNTYIVPNEAYVDASGTNEAKYYNGDTIAFKVSQTNLAQPKVNIQNLGAISIYDGENSAPLKAGVLIANRTYTFKIKRMIVSGQNVVRAIYLGQYQPHAMTVLLSQEHSGQNYTTKDGVTVELYSPEYFYQLYDVSPSALTRVINPDSPFTIEKIGSILDVDDRPNCISDDLALAQSNYNNFVSTRLTDNITITTLLIPFLDVNLKVEYKPANSDEVNQYIIDSIAHDFDNGTSRITMHRFYPLYSWI